jgi:CBS domain-containing protein
MMGGALGGIEAWVLPGMGAGFWPLVSMGAILGGTMRSPFTGVVFALELTHDVNILLPLLVAVTIAHGFTVLVLGRSILTEKVARRGFHMSREYAVDPLEILFAREVMGPAGDDDLRPVPPSVAYADEPLRMIVYRMADTGVTRFPVLDRHLGVVVGAIDLGDLLKARALNLDAERRRERMLNLRFPAMLQRGS